jgi:hypothetical protein
MAIEHTETVLEQPTVGAQPQAAPQAAPQPQANGAAPSADTEPVELTVNDLAALKQIIDVATARGAFRPQEMVPVGTTYGKLEKFLAVVAAQQKENG